jgi:hypothetical protein
MDHGVGQAMGREADAALHVRSGEDGKQRANDYWIVFDRVPAEWLSDRTQSAHGMTKNPPVSNPEIAARQTQYLAIRMHPVHAAKIPPEPAADPADMSPGAVGPHAPACSRKSLDEPSKINPSKKEKGGPSQFAARPENIRRHH